MLRRRGKLGGMWPSHIKLRAKCNTNNRQRCAGLLPLLARQTAVLASGPPVAYLPRMATVNDASDENGLRLERFREYLKLLARVNLGDQVRSKLDPSDIVQQTLLEAHRKRLQFRGTTEAEMAGWLRQLLACTLADAVRALGRAARRDA